MANCPKCDALIELDEEELGEGDTLVCEECGADLSVASIDPLELEPTEEEEEEDEDEDYDYDEDDDEEDEDEEEEENWH